MIEKLKRGDAVPYTQVSNALLTDKSLLLKEKGLLAYMLSKPDDWQFNVKSMSAELAENKDTIAAILKNLIEKRYITRTEIREHGNQGIRVLRVSITVSENFGHGICRKH